MPLTSEPRARRASLFRNDAYTVDIDAQTSLVS